MTCSGNIACLSPNHRFYHLEREGGELIKLVCVCVCVCVQHCVTVCTWCICVCHCVCVCVCRERKDVVYV